MFLAGESGVQYNLNNISAGRHTVEVVAYCRANGERISSEQKNFKCQMSLTPVWLDIDLPYMNQLTAVAFLLVPSSSPEWLA